MKLEDEIKQYHFQDDWQKALLNILYTGNWLTDNFMSISKKYGINDQHYNILRILRGRHPKCACPGEIRQVLVNKRGDLTRLLDKLDKMGLVSRNVNAENRRMVDILITQQGLDLLKKMDPIVDHVENFKERITHKEALTLNQILDKIRGNPSGQGKEKE
ncbi:MAG: MarR family transcriptional regulator [Cyclobacteriaceae bacterium]